MKRDARRVPVGGAGPALRAARRRSAYDPATTHAGLTERAALASQLHRVLARALSRPLGLFEPIALSLDELPQAQAQSLEARLAALDPSAGASPGPDGVAPALAWVIAGSVIATTPAERGQDFFYDPSRGRRAVAGGRAGVAGQHAGAAARYGRRSARCSPAPTST